MAFGRLEAAAMIWPGGCGRSSACSGIGSVYMYPTCLTGDSGSNYVEESG